MYKCINWLAITIISIIMIIITLFASLAILFSYPDSISFGFSIFLLGVFTGILLSWLLCAIFISDIEFDDDDE